MLEMLRTTGNYSRLSVKLDKLIERGYHWTFTSKTPFRIGGWQITWESDL